jgi:diadenosine tetraphosphatase ApaH/serine/threonine PP2A family protein phosphatase
LRYLFFSDIHSNLEALEAVLEHAASSRFDAMVCLGDHIGYGANPNEVVERILTLPNLGSVLGNHDAAVIEPETEDFFNAVARAGIFYSKDHVDSSSMQYLKNLPLVHDFQGDFIAVHSSPYRPESWGYVLDTEEAADAFQVMWKPLAFVGHSHFPVIFKEGGGMLPFLPNQRITLNSDEKYIINVGSVGQPRDGDPRSAYVIYDEAERIVEIFRVDYDMGRASQKILEAGLPRMLAERILRGF